MLEGLTWDEARRIRDEALTKALGPGTVSTSLPDTHSTVAAASKAILNRDVRDAAVVYDGVYTKQNPFGQVTDEELEAYKREIEIKNNPALYAEWLRQQEAEQAATKTTIEFKERSHAAARLSPIFVYPLISATSYAQSLSAPIGASSTIVSDSEMHETTYVTGSHLSPPTAGAVTSETSELEESQTTEKKQKKKRRFKLPSFSRKTRTKEKKGGQVASHVEPGEGPSGGEQSSSHYN
ncbi:unnamed protein product [Hymenolepis diminuta]|uniref:Uncharacterized protein n=1 Tax=Hymenolepis diminuta TaxID=6216 RepID=A0A3P6X0P5_HYMDI|nr:unnamed protein product [Hymenolepis diminuta]